MRRTFLLALIATSILVGIGEFTNLKLTAIATFLPASERVANNLEQSADRSQRAIGQWLLLQEQGVLANGDFIIPADGRFFDEHRFLGKTGQTVTVMVESPYFDTYVAIFNPDGTFLADNDDIDGTNKNSRVTITLPSQGYYGVLVNGCDRNSRGRYRVTVSTPTR